MKSDGILWAINVGSSSLKYSGFRWQARKPKTLTRLFDGTVENIGRSDGRMRWIEPGSEIQEQSFLCHDLAQAAHKALAQIQDHGWGPPDGIGHRFVTGGPFHRDHQRINDPLRTAVKTSIPFAPLHLPAALSVLHAVEEQYPKVPGVACFDTAFHQTLPTEASRLPLPRTWWTAGVRKYGFHGLSYEYIVTQLDPRQSGRVIVAHLGNGSSLAAIRNGASIDTTMGMTPTGGVMMATRPGDLDPGVLLYLLREGGLSVDQLDHLCNHDAGLKGVSNISGDMEQLLASTDPAASEAVSLYAYSVRKAIGALAVSMGGIDTLVFTGGIGTNAEAIRQQICSPLAFLGIHLETDVSLLQSRVVSKANSPVEVLVIPTDENLMIARHTHRLLVNTIDGNGEWGRFGPDQRRQDVEHNFREEE